VLAKNTAMAAGGDEAVFVQDGLVSECSTSNLFVVIDRTLVTMPVGPRVLPGVTRAILLELAAEMRIATEERSLGYAEAIVADEIFIASTIRELAWVGRWDEKAVGGGCCGPITRKLHEAFRDCVRNGE
jgi:D-alanine transaminase